MNTIQRRQIAKGQVIDVSIAKAAVHKSQRQRSEAEKSLRKAMVAGRLASNADTISYPIQVSD